MFELHLFIAAMGGFILFVGLVSRLMKKTVISIPMVAMGLGILIGPAGFDLLDPRRWGDSNQILEEAARLTLAVGLMGVALRLPRNYNLIHWRSMAVLLGGGMVLMCAVSGLLTWWFLGVPFLVAMMAGAVITPTDPIVASSIVTGRTAEENLTRRLRHILSAESGANDGLAYPFVLLFILLLKHAPGQAWLHWFLRVVLWDVGGAVGFGILFGLVAGHLLKLARRKNTIDQESFLAYTIALSLLTLGATRLMGIDGILAVFVAGLAINHVVHGSSDAKTEHIQQSVNLFFTHPIFILFGMMLPWQQWGGFGWKAVALPIAILLLRRLPAVYLLHRAIPALHNTDDALFAGWFGPIGVSAIFYAAFSLRETGNPAGWTIGSLLVFSSVIVHGMSAAPLTRLYGRLRKARLPVRKHRNAEKS